MVAGVDAVIPTLYADAIGCVLRFVGAEDLARLARVSRDFAASARAVAPEIWRGVDAELRELLCQLALEEVRIKGIEGEVSWLQTMGSEAGGEEDPDVQMDQFMVSFEEAADSIVRITYRVRAVLWTQATPLACLLLNARPLVLFATAALRLLHNPWLTARMSDLTGWSRYCYGDVDAVFPSPDGVAWQAAKDASRLSLGLLQQAGLEAAEEFALTLAPEAARLFLRYNKRVHPPRAWVNSDRLLTNTALMHVMGLRLGLEGVAASLNFIRWAHLKHRASREGALLASVETKEHFPEAYSDKAAAAWAEEYCIAERWYRESDYPRHDCPFCCDYFHTPSMDGMDEIDSFIRHVHGAHSMVPRVLLRDRVSRRARS